MQIDHLPYSDGVILSKIEMIEMGENQRGREMGENQRGRERERERT